MPAIKYKVELTPSQRSAIEVSRRGKVGPHGTGPCVAES